MGTWGVWCEVNGTMGYRAAWLKRDGKLAKFKTREEAELEATRLTESRMNNQYRTAYYHYSARELD